MTTIPTGEQSVADTWSQYWRSHGAAVGDWDSLSHTIFLTIVRGSGPLTGKSVMEAGCGTGRISRRLATLGARVTCLDIAPEALELAKGQFQGVPDASYIQASILSLPPEHRDDIIWNAGVLEHFDPDDQRKAIGEFLRALKPDGRIIILTPYARSFLYRVVKFLLERLRRWPYGNETPVLSLAVAIPAHGRLLKEYTISFLPFFLDCYKWIRPLKPVCLSLGRMLCLFLGDTGFARIDRRMSHFLGGYLLVSVIAERGAAPPGASV